LPFSFFIAAEAVLAGGVDEGWLVALDAEVPPDADVAGGVVVVFDAFEVHALTAISTAAAPAEQARTLAVCTLSR
jgi:hypothetical protein